uniref:PARP catalytic domain-containing protein n=2 Tax=Clytia hemisphaerica TaxID=252671 RepID=A0A7M5UUC7_9CNID
MDFEHKNKLKRNFYKLFFKILDTEIIDAVLQECNYNEHQSYEQLAMISGQRPILQADVPPTAPPYSRYTGLQSNPQQQIPPNAPYPHQQAAQVYPPQQPPIGHFRQQQQPIYQNAGAAPGGGVGGQIQPPLIQPRFVPKQLYPQPTQPGGAARAATQQERRHEPQQQPVSAPRRSVPVPRRGSDSDEDGDRALLTLALKLQLLRVLVEQGADQKKKDSDAPKRELTAGERDFPKHWPRNDRSVNIIPVKGAIFDRIKEIFHDSKTGMKANAKMKICSVDELCNMKLYEEFIVQKHCLVNDKKDLNERNLWYPSRDQFVEEICHKGIDFSNNLADGPIGTGKYFFLNATEAHERKAAHRYQKNTIAYMFLCNVLAGDITKTGPECKKVPLHSDGRSYDCSVDSILRPELYIIHHKMNCYPRYLVTYMVEE